MSAELKAVPNTIEVEEIHARAMLVSLRISTWTAQKYDKAVTKQATDANGAAGDAGRFNKMLIPSGSISYKALMKLAGSIRTEFYANTLAWADEGWRLHATANHLELCNMARDWRHKFTDLTEDFLTEYPRLRDSARLRLGSMYDERDYPTVSQIRGKFGFYLDFSPLPARGDFRVDLPKDEIRRIESEVSAKVKDATAEAMQDAWARLHKCISHIKDTLSKDEPRIYDSLIGNASDLCDILGRLNVTGDPNLEAMRLEVIENITCQDTDMLRESPELRQAAATLADDIVNRMADFYSPSV